MIMNLKFVRVIHVNTIWTANMGVMIVIKTAVIIIVILSVDMVALPLIILYPIIKVARPMGGKKIMDA